MFAFSIANVLSCFSTLCRHLIYHSVFLRHSSVILQIVSIVEDFHFLKYPYLNNSFFRVSLKNRRLGVILENVSKILMS